MSGIAPFIMLAVGVLVCIGLLAIPIAFRKVVETNKVHIVQSGKRTTSYGTGQENGNVYYCWPSWMPILGVTRIVLPVNNFELSLKDYEAYDKERVPFALDVVSFFQINDTNVAATRIASFEHLREQLVAVLQGAVRKILASHDINAIMTDRATFGEQFTKEVTAELENWGVKPVKNMELMDIRDSKNSNVIANIMAMKTSQIEMESRTVVAANHQKARSAEIEAERTVQLSEQAAAQEVGQRTAEKEKAVGIALQKSLQDIATEEAMTTERRKAVERIAAVKQAELEKESALVTAEQQKQMAILDAQGKLESAKHAAEGVVATGEANARAESALLLAPVNAQIALAKEIGSNAAYQTYLIRLKEVEGQVSVGTAQAEALKKAEVKIIANTGNATSGITDAMQLFTPQGGLSLGGMLEAFKNTPQGEKLLKGLTDKLGAVEIKVQKTENGTNA